MWSGGKFSLGRGHKNVVDVGDEVSMIIHHIETDTSFPIEDVKVRKEGKVNIPNPFVRTYKIQKDDVIDVYVWTDQPLIERGQA